MPNKRDFYDVLGVDKKATAAELKAAYRKKALEWHPDRNKSPEAESKFKEINEAYEILSNTDKRAAYDQYGHGAFEQGGMGGPGGFGGFGGQQGGQQGPFSYYYTSGGQQGQSFDFGDFSDPFEIFEQFFGGASPFGRQQRRTPRYGLSLSFMEAAKGVEKDVEIEGKRRKLKIPAGVDEGSRIDFGEFYVTVDVKPDKIFKREDNDVFVDMPISITTAILGGEVEVPTIDGDLKLKIRNGTQPGTMVRLSGRGIKHLHGSGRGDEYVRLLIKVPEKISQKQKELLEEFEKVTEKKGWF
jgi:DnaJ-class molecular chaperone